MTIFTLQGKKCHRARCCRWYLLTYYRHYCSNSTCVPFDSQGGCVHARVRACVRPQSIIRYADCCVYAGQVLSRVSTSFCWVETLGAVPWCRQHTAASPCVGRRITAINGRYTLLEPTVRLCSIERTWRPTRNDALPLSTRGLGVALQEPRSCRRLCVASYGCVYR